MPKFISPRDVSFFKRISRELIDVVIQNTLVLFKVNLNETKVNLYGESVNKTWHLGVELFCLIEMDPENMQYEGFGPDNTQNMVFRLDRDMCSEKNSYPEVGDIIYFDTNYYEIDNTNEIQFIGGLPVNTYSILCSAFLVSKSNLNIEERTL